jgi:Ca-activated chloride channel homolog
MRFRSLLQILVTLLMLTFLLGLSSFAQEHKHEMPPQDPATLKLSTEMVSLSVTATDQKGKAVLGLKREDFKVYENGVEQRLDFFSTEETPVCWGLVLDRSGSMWDMIGDVYRAAVHVVDEGTEEDETFIVTFNKKVELVTDFISDKHRLENSILGLRAGGETALWDAISFGLKHLKEAKHRKKVLVVITDGEDNSSRTAFRNLVGQAEEAGVLIYTVGMFESFVMRGFGMRGSPREELAKLAEITGASAHFPTNVEECQETMRTIAGEVGHQYSLGYYPSDTKNDGKWRKLQVVVNQNQGKAKYVARTRAGYYAPKNDVAK